jgi:hypothetical protein
MRDENNRRGLLMHSKGVECISKIDWDDKSKGFKHGGDILKGNQ